MKIKYRVHWKNQMQELSIERDADLFTGYKDKNGKDIYTGDVITQKLTDPLEPKGYNLWYGYVALEKGRFVIKQVGFNYSNSPIEDYTMLHDEAHDIEVVGNIYDGKDYIKMYYEQDLEDE